MPFRPSAGRNVFENRQGRRNGAPASLADVGFQRTGEVLAVLAMSATGWDWRRKTAPEHFLRKSFGRGNGPADDQAEVDAIGRVTYC